MCPRPRPDNCGTAAPSDASNGTSTRETLSPTPPVECLSTVGRDSPERSMTSPEPTMAPVRSEVSRADMPLQVDGHQPGSDLFVRDRPSHVSVDKPIDLLGRQLAAVALRPDQVDGVETGGGRGSHRQLPPSGVPVPFDGAVARRCTSSALSKAPGSNWPSRCGGAVGPASRSSSGPPCSISNWRHRPQGVSGRPSPAVTLTANSRPCPPANRAETSPHSAQSVSPYDAFSTLQPVTTTPSSQRPAAPTVRPE